MRDAGIKEHTVWIYDSIGKCTHELYFRLPSTEEHIEYRKNLFVREGDEAKNESFRIQAKMGYRILLGFKKGTFGLDGQPYASDPDDPDYRQDWKEIIAQDASDILAAVAQKAFAAVFIAPDQDKDLNHLPDERVDGPLGS